MNIRSAWRLLAASAIVGVAGMVQAQATDWSALDKKGGWETGQQSAPRSAGPEQSAAPKQSQFESDISSAFQNLGMTQVRADCYGRVLQQKLKPKHQDDAVKLLRTSDGARDVRKKVMAKGFDIMGGFRAASKSCPEQMGG